MNKAVAATLIATGAVIVIVGGVIGYQIMQANKEPKFEANLREDNETVDFTFGKYKGVYNWNDPKTGVKSDKWDLQISQDENFIMFDLYKDGKKVKELATL